MSTIQKVVVCGTLFGQVYLSAFKRSFPGFQLAGILAKGSKRSHQLAKQYKVPLFTDVDELPKDIDIACVVIRSSIVGGAGSDIAKKLLARGISVLQEHPVYITDVVECLKLARQHNCVYQVNTHYAHVNAVRQFISYARALSTRQKILFIEATCGVQVVCGLIDILGRILGRFSPYYFQVLPKDIGLTNLLETPAPYTVIQGVIAGIPICIHLQNELNPSDPDNHFHIMHRLCIGVSSGNLLLVNTHGPVIFSPRFHIPRQYATSTYSESDATEEQSYYLQNSLYEIFPSSNYNLTMLLGEQWPIAIQHALRETLALKQSLTTTTHAQLLISFTQVWKSLMEKVGNPNSVHIDNPVPVSPSVTEFIQHWQESES